MGVGQSDASAIGLPDMGDDGAAADRMGADETRDVGACGGFGIVEGARRAALVKGDAPAVAMRADAAAAPGEAGEGKANVGRDIRAHSKQFAHRDRRQRDSHSG